ncbi:MAG: methylenetetrahydrofolate reductase [Bacteroidales bacterium]|nr:methylenetetrahydrofolate reductase [Bacteroidales bacterium]
MRISDILRIKKTFSFEVFPPKPEISNLQDIYGTIDALQQYRPDFISVTFKASGDNSRNTLELARYIQRHTHAEPLVHLTCGSLDRDEVDAVAETLEREGMENVLALRGDKPGESPENYLKCFRHASELMAYLRSNHSFCMGGACYPEGHIECDSLYDDLHFMKAKQDMGASFLITQLFYDNNYFYRLLRVAKKMGITIPIIPGIMPLTSATMFNRIMHMAGASIPFELRVLFDRFQNDKEAMYEIGIAFSVNQIIELLANDADGIHIYTMNNARVAADIYQRIHHVIEKELR